MKNNKGFTLIELLVVIAVLGILAAVVLVAINPTARMNDAKDAGLKNDVGQIALAVESCYTKNEGSYATCATIAELAPAGGAGYLKAAPPSTTGATPRTKVCAVGDEVAVSADLWTGTDFWVYNSSTGATTAEAIDPCAP